MTTIKAIRATIKLGDIELDVFQLPDGSYRWSSKNITEAINIRHSRVAQIWTSKQGQRLMGKRFEKADFSPTKLTTNDCGNISGYSTDVAFFIWMYEAVKGNKLAKGLIIASATESLERRADRAFGVTRTEDERNKRLAQRTMNVARVRTLEDAISDYAIKQGFSEAYIKATYSDCINYITNMLEENDRPPSDLDLAKRLTLRTIDGKDIDPLEAAKQIAALCFTKTVGLE
jgi:hypothetical protein